MVLRENLTRLGVGGRFIDFGCGRGDVAETLIRETGITGGVAYDLAVDEDQQKLSGERAGGKRLVYINHLSEEHVDLDLAILFDVIEHVPDPAAVLRTIEQRIRPGGWLAVTVPYNAREWGVDDDFYGHLRRLSMRGIVSMLENGGWNVVRVLDPSFPTFWVIRRGYLFTRRFARQPVNARAVTSGSDMERTLISARQSAWDTGGIVQRILSYGVIPWQFVRKFDLYFESIYKGFELFVICQKRVTSHLCGVCGNGQYSYHGFFQRYSLQRCTYCRSEKMLPESHARTDHGTGESENESMPGLLSRVLRRLRRRRIRSLMNQRVKPGSLLIVSRNPRFDVGAPESGAGVAADVCDLQAWMGEPPAAEERRYGALALFHVFEHVRDIGRALDALDRAVEPGGYVLLEYPNSRSFLKRLFRWRWFGYDPPNHFFIIDSQALSDRMGMRNYRLITEKHFALEYSYLIFAQTLINALMPFQRDALYRWIRRARLSCLEQVWACLSIPLMIVFVPLYLVYQPLASWFRAGCVVQQVFRRTDIVE